MVALKVKALERGRTKQLSRSQDFEAALERGEEMGVRSWVKRKEHLAVGSVLGKGSWGTVHKCKYEGQSCVAKLITPSAMRPSDISLLQNEVSVWTEVEHPNCLQFRGVVFCAKDTGYYLLCDYMSGGSLAAHLASLRESKAAPPRLEVVSAELKQVASAMVHLHAKDIVHRDLKSSNVLIASDGRLCISDFGLARKVCPRGSMTAETGSYRWMAPEVIRHEKYGVECDVYSFAMLCTEMLNYHVPFPSMSPVQAALAVAKEKWRPPLRREAPSAMASLCCACWQEDPKQRPTFLQICSLLDASAMHSSVHAASAVAGASVGQFIERGTSSPNSRNGTSECKRASWMSDSGMDQRSPPVRRRRPTPPCSPKAPQPAGSDEVPKAPLFLRREFEAQMPPPIARDAAPY